MLTAFSQYLLNVNPTLEMGGGVGGGDPVQYGTGGSQLSARVP